MSNKKYFRNRLGREDSGGGALLVLRTWLMKCNLKMSLITVEGARCWRGGVASSFWLLPSALLFHCFVYCLFIYIFVSGGGGICPICLPIAMPLTLGCELTLNSIIIYVVVVHFGTGNHIQEESHRLHTDPKPTDSLPFGVPYFCFVIGFFSVSLV